MSIIICIKQYKIEYNNIIITIVFVTTETKKNNQNFIKLTQNRILPTIVYTCVFNRKKQTINYCIINILL